MLKHQVEGQVIHVETDALKASIRTEGYVSGVAAGSLLDKKTGARDLGFGLSIVDFLLEPGEPNSKPDPKQYQFGSNNMVHGNIAKRYVEGPQICTQAKKLPYEIFTGDGFLGIKLRYQWSQAHGQHRAGSWWEQTLIFLEKERFFLSADRVTTVNKSDALFLRIDMPGHIKHRKGSNFEHVYLSYEGAYLPSTDFEFNAQPEEQYFYSRRKRAKIPGRFIRAYQVLKMGRPGPWLAGITLNPEDVHEAWCHQRDYVCMIQEIGGWPTQPGDTFGAAHAVGWFDRVGDMNAAADKYQGWSGIDLAKANGKTGFSGVQQEDLEPIAAKG
ncbi:MAG: hypothetical protein N2C14_06025 [Planctomycetales bacterium]